MAGFFDDRWAPDQSTAEYIANWFNSVFFPWRRAAVELHGTGWLVAIYDDRNPDEYGGWICHYFPPRFVNRPTEWINWACSQDAKDIGETIFD